MRELLGLSLTANKVVWTLVDLADGTIVAEDIVEVDSPENVANAAADSVEAFATRSGREVQAVRIAWSKGTAGSALKLTSKLRSLGFSDIDLVSEDEARHSRNRTARFIDPPLELAYGAARTVAAEDRGKPLRRMAARLPARRLVIAVAGSVVVLAAVTAAAGYSLVDEAPLQAADHAPPPVAPALPPDSGPPNGAVPNDAPVVVVPAAVQPPPPAPVPPPAEPEVFVAPPVALALSPVEAAAPVIVDEPVVASEPEPAAVIHTAPTRAQAAPIARQPHLTHEAPTAGPMTIPGSALLPDTAPATGTTPAAVRADQPHLTPEALSARPLPGPVPLMSLVGAPAPPPPPPPPSNPFDILAALP